MTDIDTMRALDNRQICRFVRDTQYHRRLPTLIRRFGWIAVDHALKRGLIERQVWQGNATDFVDLSQLGSDYLVGCCLRRDA